MGFFAGKNIFITGIGGFIGSNLAENLVKQGANVVGLVRGIDDQQYEILSKCRIYVGDICDLNILREIISSNEVDYVIHLAAYSIVRISARDPYTTYAVNVMGTVNLLEACRQVGRCKRIIVSSSDKAYGDHDTLPYQETFPLQPINTYDVSKCCADMIARSYAKTYGMPIIVTRCSNVYGKGDRNKSRIIPNTISRLLNGLEPEIYSDVYGMTREFIEISDVVAAYEEIAKVELNVPVDVYNIGTDNPIEIAKLVDKISLATVGKIVPPIVRERNFGEIQNQFISAKRLMKHTPWRPKVNLDDGIKKTVEWYRKLIGV